MQRIEQGGDQPCHPEHGARCDDTIPLGKRVKIQGHVVAVAHECPLAVNYALGIGGAARGIDDDKRVGGGDVVFNAGEHRLVNFRAAREQCRSW